MAQKRKLDDGFDAEPTHEPAAKKTSADMPFLSHFDMLFHMPRDGASPDSQNSLPDDSLRAGRRSKLGRKWRTLGTPAVPSSLPLSNMVSAVQELIDPEFDPLIPVLDDEPRYLKPLPSRIAPDDVEFLRHKGALTIPENELRDELLRCYVQWVHNFMPMLNLREFLRCIAENDPNGNISLLLFQAVMFAGTAFVDLKHLQAAGYATRKSARKAFFTRVKLLYSFDYEEDRIAILQTLLLMTYWADEESSPEKDIWHWVGVCNTQAHSIGLHRDPTKSDMDPTAQRLRIRLWWTLYSRDRLIAMGLRRPTHINEGTCDVPMLRLSDFDIEPFPDSVTQLLRCRQLEDVSHQRCLATMFIEKVKLCQCLGRVLFAQYSPSNHHFGATDKTTITLVPRQASEAELARCSQKLDSWLSGLPKDAQFIPASRAHIKDGENVLLLHSAMLRMIYHATSSALHRPRALTFANKDRSKSGVKWSTTARTKLQDAAIGITHIVQGLSQLNLTKFLPQSGVTVLLPAAVAHLVNLTSSNPTVRQVSIYNFHRCVQALQALKDIYPAADIEAAHLEAAAKKQFMDLNMSLDTIRSDIYSFTNVNQLDSSESPPEIQASSPDSCGSIYHRKAQGGALERADRVDDDIDVTHGRNIHAEEPHGAENGSRIRNENHPVSNDFDMDFFLDYPETESSCRPSADPPPSNTNHHIETSPPRPDSKQQSQSPDTIWTLDIFSGWTGGGGGGGGGGGASESHEEDTSSNRKEDDHSERGPPDKMNTLSRSNGRDITGDLEKDLGFL